MIDRRSMMAGVALAAGAAPALARTTAPAQTPPAAAPAQPSLAERLTQRAAENRRRIRLADGVFSGEGWDLLTSEAGRAHAVLIGEEHGIAENPKMVAALIAAARGDGPAVLGLEVSPFMAVELDRAARDGVDGLRRMYADPTRMAAFYSMREEAEMLAAVRAAAPGDAPAFWGLDYDVAADRFAIRTLKAMEKPAAATAALDALEAASTESWARYAETHGPQFIFNFAGDPALVRAVREAWPQAPADASWMLEVMEETLEINRLFVAGRGQASNQRRADLNKRNLLRHWSAARAAHGRAPKAFYKFGASHMVRGLSTTESFDLGTMIPELAAVEGGSTFSMMVLPGKGAATAVFDPSAMTFRQGPPSTGYGAGLDLLIDQAFDSDFTLFDLRPLRPLLSGGARSASQDRELVRTIHGFDTLLVMAGSTPSGNL